ncbi:MAG: hypothetical protein DRJ61_04605 [Acidobacteria bacterium]|nr:MAG: hypothetical protein DRJ61_04605 [Acidobacteriota bacterium]
MRTRKTLTTIVLVFSVAAAIGWAASVNSQNGVGHSDHNPAKVVDVSLIFADGFESGDTSEWGQYCTLSTLDLPIPAKRN